MPVSKGMRIPPPRPRKVSAKPMTTGAPGGGLAYRIDLMINLQAAIKKFPKNTFTKPSVTYRRAKDGTRAYDFFISVKQGKSKTVYKQSYRINAGSAVDNATYYIMQNFFARMCHMSNMTHEELVEFIDNDIWW